MGSLPSPGSRALPGHRTLSHHAGASESGQEELSFLRYKGTVKLGAALSNARGRYHIDQKNRGGQSEAIYDRNLRIE